MARKKTHTLLVTLTFDKPCSQAFALHAARNNIHGDFWENPWEGQTASRFRVRSFKPARKTS